MKKRSFFILMLFASVFSSFFVVIYLHQKFFGKRIISISQCIGQNWNSNYDAFLVQKIKLPNGDWTLVNSDSSNLNLGNFDEVFFVGNENFTINNLFARRKDSIFLIDALSKRVIKYFKGTKVRWERNIPIVSLRSDTNYAKPNLYLIASLYHDSVQQLIESKYGKNINNSLYKFVSFEGPLIKVKEGFKYGYIRRNGEILIPSNYNYLETFNSNNTIIFQNDSFSGLINRQGKILTKYSSEYEIVRHQQHFIIKTSRSASIVNMNGENIFGKDWQDIRECNYRYLYVLDKFKWGVYDLVSSRLILDCLYDQIMYNDNFFIEKNGLKGIYSPSGTPNIRCKYKDIKNALNGNYYVNINGLWGIVNSNDQILLGAQFTSIDYVSGSNNLLYVRRNNKVGIYNINSNDYIIPCQFESIQDFNQPGLYYVSKNGLYGIYNTNSKRLSIPVNYSSIVKQDYQNYARVTNLKGLTGWMDYYNGSVMIPEKFVHVEGDFNNSLSRVKVKYSGVPCRIRPNGTLAEEDITVIGKKAWDRAMEKLGDLIP